MVTYGFKQASLASGMQQLRPSESSGDAGVGLAVARPEVVPEGRRLGVHLPGPCIAGVTSVDSHACGVRGVYSARPAC